MKKDAKSAWRDINILIQSKRSQGKQVTERTTLWRRLTTLFHSEDVFSETNWDAYVSIKIGTLAEASKHTTTYSICFT